MKKKSQSEQLIMNPNKNVMKDPRQLNVLPLSRPSRVIIDRVLPEIDGGRFAAKRFIDEEIQITAHLLVDGHDLVKGQLLIRSETEQEFKIFPLLSLGNDEYAASFRAEKLGRYFFTVRAGIDRFGTWKSDILKKAQATQNVRVDLLAGLQLLQSWSAEAEKTRADEKSATLQKALAQLKLWSEILNPPTDFASLEKFFADPLLIDLAADIHDKSTLVYYEREIPLQVEPVLARFSSWYEFFPRSSATSRPQKHGTFKDAQKRLAAIKKMGFNVVYFPPIHPIGQAFRKGKNNTLTATPQDVGSPWAVGSAKGGHRDILPELGTFQDFAAVVSAARDLNMEIALDIAFQCSPDHPYVKEHPQWFKQRADGSIQYAENPPKKYQDIYPFDFESADWQALWLELRDVVKFWVDQGVRVFRVDNPHTKALHFWEWLMASIRAENPEVIFLAEAFTRPKLMAYLAKAGFSQSYTYFTWRNSKWELTQYLTELTQTELVDFFGANFWPNTPDILPTALQSANRSIYMQRLLLAATLSSSYGIYGPAFELMESRVYKAGGEEYLDSEKYELRPWDLQREDSLASFIARVNEIRGAHPALQQNRSLRFHPVNNEHLIAYSKTHGSEIILVIVSLNAAGVEAGLVELPLLDWKIEVNEVFEAHDLLTDARYYWNGWRNFVELSPHAPAHILHIKPASPFKHQEKKI